MNAKTRTLIFLCGFMALVLGALFARVLAPTPLSQDDLRKQGFYLLDHPRPVANFNLLNHKGTAVDQSMFRDKWSVIFFGYTFCPDVCPTTMSLMNQVQSRLSEDMRDQLQVVLVSVDPERDTVEKMGQYVPYFNPDFVGLTGDIKQITRLATTVSVVFAKTQFQGDSYLVDHSASLVLLSPEGHYVGFFRAPHQAETIAGLLPRLMTGK